MAAIEMTISLNDAALSRALDQAIQAGTNLRQPMGEIAAEWMTLVHARFESESDPLGVPWARRWRDPASKDEDDGHKLLQLSRALHNAIVPDFGPDFAQVGVLNTAGPARYARIHNEGGTIVPKHKQALSFGGRIVSQVVMPKRQYLGFGPKEQATVTEVMGDFLRGVLSGADA